MDNATKRTLAKNTLWLFTGQTIGRLLRAAIVIYAARVLGAASWGAFSYALSLAAFLTIFSDIGINALITREGVKNPELRSKYLATALFIKLGFLAVLIFSVLIFADKLTNLEEAAVLMPIIVFVFVFDSLRDLGAAMARAMERMEIEGIVNILTNLAIFSLGLAFLKTSPTSASLAWAYAAGTGAGVVAIIIPLRHYFRGILRNFDKNLVKPILTSAWPFGLLGLMGVIMINTDILMLGWLRSAGETGFYSAAQKPIQLLYTAPVLIAAAFFPILSRLAGREGFKRVFEQGLAAVYLLALPLTIGGVILNTPIIKLLYGSEYFSASTTFAILALTMSVVFPSILITNAVFAQDKQKTLIPYVILGVFGNIFFNIILIPKFGIEGAAVSTLINQIIINAYLWRKFKKISDFSIFGRLTKILAAAAVMGAVVLLLRFYGLNVLINILISGAAYLGMLIILKEPVLKTAKLILRKG